MTREESAGVPSLFRLCGNDGQSETPIYMPELRLRHLSLSGAVRRLRRMEHAGRRGGRDGLFGQARPQPRWAHPRPRHARPPQQVAPTHPLPVRPFPPFPLPLLPPCFCLPSRPPSLFLPLFFFLSSFFFFFF